MSDVTKILQKGYHLDESCIMYLHCMNLVSFWINNQEINLQDFGKMLHNFAKIWNEIEFSKSGVPSRNFVFGLEHLHPQIENNTALCCFISI